MSDLLPEGRDEREAMIAAWREYRMACRGRDGIRPARRVDGRSFEAGYRAALVESEARERELEAKIRALEAMLPDPDYAARVERSVGTTGGDDA